jgi:hypothetical protein
MLQKKLKEKNAVSHSLPVGSVDAEPDRIISCKLLHSIGLGSPLYISKSG